MLEHRPLDDLRSLKDGISKTSIHPAKFIRNQAILDHLCCDLIGQATPILEQKGSQELNKKVISTPKRFVLCGVGTLMNLP